MDLGFLDPGSRIPNPSSVTNVLVKSAIILFEMAQVSFCSNMKYFQFKKFVATKKGKTTRFSPSSFVAVVGSGIRDGEKSGSGAG
jgi:hypothetical protein